MQDDHVCRPRDYIKNGQFYRTFYPRSISIILQLTFALWELAKNRHTQETLRKEVEEKLRKIRSEGGDDFTPDDFNSMPYLLAVVKVCPNQCIR